MKHPHLDIIYVNLTGQENTKNASMATYSIIELLIPPYFVQVNSFLPDTRSGRDT